ncbi:MAG: alkaline phosphatase family protein [Syntrophobacterales bacterium]|nr:MAG: alkaline phosphatase family protein [Syntrophobacterales bacterium]
MGLFDRFSFKGKKVLVIGLDGVPFSLIKGLSAEGKLPHWSELMESGSFKRMNSVHPCVSSVAWATYMTGKNPGKHNIYGFVDRYPRSMDVFIPTSRDMAGKSLWEILSQAGKRVVVINVPLTFPPREVNGILISGFLCTNIEKIAHPKEFGGVLKEMGYRIDVDAWQARKSLDKFLEDLHLTLEKRIEAMFHFLEREKWDFFQLHIMETDRINHFLWGLWEEGDAQYGPEFIKYYQKIDAILGRISAGLDGDTRLIVLSDHGFCGLKKEVFLNYWLQREGWLKFREETPKSVKDIHQESKAYSLIPGRIYVNLTERESSGSVSFPDEYDRIRDEVQGALLGMKDPDSGERIIEKVIKREELYHGPHYNDGPDLVAIPHNGYDLKGNLDKKELTYKGPLVGMHTYDDAFLYIKDVEVPKMDNQFGVMDVMPTILKLMGVNPPEDLDGEALV